MTTEERVVTLMAEANPVPDLDAIDIAQEATAYLVTLSQRSSEMTQLETKPTEKTSEKKGRLVTVIAVAAALLIGAVAILTQRDETPPPATEPAPTLTTLAAVETPTTVAALDPQVEGALAVGSGFVQALASGDSQGVGDLAIEGHIGGLVVSSLERLREEMAWLEAVGWSITIEECSVTNPDLANTRVRCTVSHTNALSNALGVGPYSGAYNMRVHHQGDETLGRVLENTAVSENLVPEFPVSIFTSETWEPVMTWLETNYPDDVALMFAGEGWLNPSLTPESIELWRQHTEEFGADQGQG